MGNRKDALDFSAFTLDGTSFLGNLKSFDFGNDLTRVNVRGLSQRFHRKKVTGRKNKFTATIMNVDDAGHVQLNLDVSLFTVGAAALLGELKSGKIKGTNTAKDGKGIADLDNFPNLTGTMYEVSGDLMVSTSALLVAQAGATMTLTDFEGEIQIVAGSIDFAAPMTIVSSTHKITEDEIQTYSIALECQGSPGSPSDGSHLFGLALSSGQTAEVLLYANTGGNIYGSGAAIPCAITEFEVAFQGDAVISETYTFETEGNISIATE